MDCYEILEVSQNASPEVIKAAYKSLMQRYHPDKNPDNPQIAARALQVTQAYEVLSDAERRAAYDVKLKQQLSVISTGRREGSGEGQGSYIAGDSQAAQMNQSYWLIWLLIALIIAICLYAMSLFGTDPENGILNTGAANPAQVESENAKVGLPRTIPVYLSDLNVELSGSGGLAGAPSRVLNIPTLGIRVGAFEANKVLGFMNSNKELVRQQLEERLVYANYDELIKSDGEQYLKQMIINSIGDTTGTNQFNADPLNIEQAGQYGVVEVSLPRSFSVR